VDGTCAAAVAKKFLGTVKFHPASAGSQPPEDITGKNVLILDMAYNKKALDEMLKKVNKLLILDHHKTNMADLQDIPNENKVLDMNKSGAMLAWDYFYPGVTPPLLVQYVQDRDIWTKKLPNNELFVSWFYKLPFDYDEYIKYFDDELIKKNIGLTISNNFMAETCRMVDEYYIDEHIKYAPKPLFINIKDNYYFVAHSNTSSAGLKSDIGNRLFSKYELIDFSCVGSNTINTTHMSLRSIDTAVDVSEIAKIYSGGGHRNASGVKLDGVVSHLGKVLDTHCYKLLKDIYFGELIIIKKDGNILRHTCIYMYSPYNKKELAKYLLQSRGTGNTLNCIDIYNKVNPTQLSHDFRVNVAIVWDYNPLENITYFVLKFNKDVTEAEKDVFSYHFGTDINFPFVCKGLHKSLDTNIEVIKKEEMDDE
jgi:oligoribonuclease NrnB/cAMP/cGMP phosphodiesterase (DHH superfamily)